MTISESENLAGITVALKESFRCLSPDDSDAWRQVATLCCGVLHLDTRQLLVAAIE